MCKNQQLSTLDPGMGRQQYCQTIPSPGSKMLQKGTPQVEDQVGMSSDAV